MTLWSKLSWLEKLRVAPGHKFQRDRIHAVAQAGRIGAVVKNMPQMSVAPRALHFALQDAQVEIISLVHIFSCQHCPKTRPAGTRFKFCSCVKQSSDAIHAAENSFAVFVQQFAR